jgi:hypothetical protein
MSFAFDSTTPVSGRSIGMENAERFWGFAHGAKCVAMAVRSACLKTNQPARGFENLHLKDLKTQIENPGLSTLRFSETVKRVPLGLQETKNPVPPNGHVRVWYCFGPLHIDSPRLSTLFQLSIHGGPKKKPTKSIPTK